MPYPFWLPIHLYLKWEKNTKIISNCPFGSNHSLQLARGWIKGVCDAFGQDSEEVFEKIK